MAKLVSISVPDGDEAFWKEFKEAAAREGGVSAVLVKEAKEWYKAHGKGNPSFTLETFNDPEVKAYPTAWKTLGRKDVAGIEPEEIREMSARLAKNSETLAYLAEHPVPTTASKSKR